MKPLTSFKTCPTLYNAIIEATDKANLDESSTLKLNHLRHEKVHFLLSVNSRDIRKLFPSFQCKKTLIIFYGATETCLFH